MSMDDRRRTADAASDSPAEGGRIRVIVKGHAVNVEPRPDWTIGAIATAARWSAGCGPVPFDNWEIRTADGRLLDPYAQPGALRVLMVDLLAGVGA